MMGVVDINIKALQYQVAFGDVEENIARVRKQFDRAELKGPTSSCSLRCGHRDMTLKTSESMPARTSSLRSL